MATGSLDGPRGVADAELAALLRQLRVAAELTQEQLAAQSQISPRTVKNYESGGRVRRSHELNKVLDVLPTTPPERERVLRLHRATQPDIPDAADLGWASRARAAGFTVWPLNEFSAAEATVHSAIGPLHPFTPKTATAIAQPPLYVRRDHDTALRHEIATAAAGDLQAMILLRGSSSTGKTRSLLEAIHHELEEVGGDWVVVRPARTPEGARLLDTCGLFDRPCVVWLNELQSFLGPDGTGLSKDVLRGLYAVATAPVVLVATLWPDKLLAATSERDDRASEARELLASKSPWVRVLDIPPTLTSDRERDEARRLAWQDVRLGEALADRDGFGFAQTLAGAHQLLHHYAVAPPVARLLIEAAADARRLGYGGVLAASALQELAVVLWREEKGRRHLAGDILADALDYASAGLRDDHGVRALIPVDEFDLVPEGSDHRSDEVGPVGLEEPAGYDLADYLQQHLSRSRMTRDTTCRFWNVLLRNTHSVDTRLSLARAAHVRGHPSCAELAYRSAAAVDPAALTELVRWLRARPGRGTEAEQIYRDAAASDTAKLTPPAPSSRTRPSRDAAAEGSAQRHLHRHAVHALRHQQPGRLRTRPGREVDVEGAYRDAADAGNSAALIDMARWLETQPGREVDVEGAYRDAVAAGNRAALTELARWLRTQPGREVDIEGAYRDAAAGGTRTALAVLARWLHTQPGREADVEQVYRDDAATGDPFALAALAGWLRTQAGRESDVENAYRDAAAAGAQSALTQLAAWLDSQPGREADAANVRRRGVETS